MPNNRFTRKPGRGGSRSFPPSPANRDKKILSSGKQQSPENPMNTGMLISPDSKKPIQFGIQRVIKILKEKDNRVYKHHELKAMLYTWRNYYKKKSNENINTISHEDIVLELQRAQTQLLLHQENDFPIDEVVAIFNDQHEKTLKSLTNEDLREILRVWKKHKREDTSQLSKMTDIEISSILHNIKASVVNKDVFNPIQETIFDQVDKETDHMFEVVNRMNISANTTENQVLEFNDEELAFFQYVHSLNAQKVPDLDVLHGMDSKKYRGTYRTTATRKNFLRRRR